MQNTDRNLRQLIISRIKLNNPWWQTGVIPCDYLAMRERPLIRDFYPAVADLDLKRAPILMGPRRVGKTVMLYHCIKRLIEAGIEPRRIIYLSIDTPVYSNQSLEMLFGMAREAAGVEESYDRFYVFYDEIQYLKDWEVHLKSMVDTFRQSKFVASGSAAAALKMKSIESGAGRFRDFMLPPLTFAEYIHLMNLDNLITETGDPKNPFGSDNIELLNRHFVRYINFGGYPEVAFSNEIQSDTAAYVKNDIIEKVLLRDLPSLYGVSDIQELNMFFAHIAYRSGGEFSYQSLSTDSGIRKETLKKYLEYLEAAFLIKIVHRIDHNAKHLQRTTTFKIYLTNPMLKAALFTPVSEKDDSFGNMVETAIFAQWIPSASNTPYYANWHKGRNKGEVDMVWLNAVTQKTCSATEVKWSNRYLDNTHELESLTTFLQLNPTIAKVIVTTINLAGRRTIADKEVVLMPAALYAYWVSYRILNKNESNLFTT